MFFKKHNACVQPEARLRADRLERIVGRRCCLSQLPRLPNAMNAMHELGLRLDLRSGLLRTGAMRDSRLRALLPEECCANDIRILVLALEGCGAAEVRRLRNCRGT